MYFNDASLTNGIRQVEEVDVINVYEVDNDLTRTEWFTDQYSILSESKEIYSVIVEAACEVSKENQYFYNGINYFLLFLLQKIMSVK